MVSVKPGDSHLVKSILINDLLEVIDFKRAIMKIDIQGHEYEGFQHADKLFAQIDIPIVLMEWVLFRFHKDQSIPIYFRNFFKRFNYEPYSSIASNVPLKGNHSKWPYDVFWKKRYP